MMLNLLITQSAKSKKFARTIKMDLVLEDLQCKGLKIYQSKNGYRFTSDSVALANFVSVKNNGILIDFCSGSGIVGLEVIGRIPTEELFQFELQPELAKMCEQTNFLNNEKTQITLYNESLIN